MNRLTKVVGGIIAAVVLIGIGASLGDDSGNNIQLDKAITDVPDQAPTATAATLQRSRSEENAIRKAEEYLDFMAFSHSGLIDQLEFEGFTGAEATLAVDSLNVDWNEQAWKKAEEYLDTMAFSRSGLIEQLEFEGFSNSQATYGVNKAGL